MLSRRNTATIISRKWKSDKKSKIDWLVIQTDKTGSSNFRTVGVTPLDAKLPHESSFLLNSIIEIGDLHCIPVARDLLANVKNGVNFQIGVMNDGLVEHCGKLIFARMVNMTNIPYAPSYQMTETAWQAARIFARKGKKQAAKFLENSGLFDSVFNFQVGGPARSDDCVIEIEHNNFQEGVS